MNQKCHKRLQRLSAWVLCCSLALLLAGAACSAVAQTDDSLYLALSARHSKVTPAELEEMAGGKEALIARLIELRRSEGLPHVGIRAERYLLKYLDNEKALAAVEEDLRSERYPGLARIVVFHIDSVENEGVRSRLARQAIERTKTDTDFSRFTKGFASSKHQDLRKLAAETSK